MEEGVIDFVFEQGVFIIVGWFMFIIKFLMELQDL